MTNLERIDCVCEQLAVLCDEARYRNRRKIEARLLLSFALSLRREWHEEDRLAAVKAKKVSQ